METTNHIQIALPQDRTFELYTCHERLPLWSPGFLSIETLKQVEGAVGNVYLQRYKYQDRIIEERVTLLAIDVPDGFHVLADTGQLQRETKARFEVLDDSNTRIINHNRFSGEHLPNLVKQELEAYAQFFLEAFRAFAEGQSALRHE